MSPHRSLFSQHPLAQLAVAFAAGVCAAHYFPLRLSGALGAVCFALVVVLRNRRAAGIVLLLAMFFAGTTLAELERRAGETSDLKRVLTQTTDDYFTLSGVLDRPPEFARDRL